jgi:crotonobetainyl-CoA:carnitine CoA-transferase CaiB-like acyl-CoA transferase
MSDDEMTGAQPLAGLVVVEIGHSVAAPYAGMILAGLGADVLKIESPKGDDTRAWGPPFVDGLSTMFQTMNRNKRSAVVDLKDEGQRAALRAYIVDNADVVIQNLRPGAIAGYGLDGASLRADKPALIACSMGAFGPAGPLASRPGYDPLMQAFGGVMSVTGHAGAAPVRTGPSIIDQGTAMWTVIGVLAALSRRAATGVGCEVDTCLLETALAWVAPFVANYSATGQVPRQMGSEIPTIAPYGAFEAADGWLVIAAGNDTLFGKLAGALGHPEWPADPRLATNPGRVEHRETVNRLVGEVVAGRSRAHWVGRFDGAGVPCAPVQTIDEVIAHPQVRASGMMQDPPTGSFPLLGLPLAFDGKRPPFRSVAPELGADTDAVLGAPAHTRKAV